MGAEALFSNTTGSSNNAFGFQALYYSAEGSSNTAVGYQAGRGASGNSFSNNSLFGYQAGSALTSGSNNVLLGYQAGNALTSGSNNIIIGYDIDAGSDTGNNQLNIGDVLFGDLSSGYIGIGTVTPGAILDVRGGIAAGTNGTEFTVSTAGAITGASFTDGTLSVTGGAITGGTGITSSGTITFSGIGAGTDNSVLVLNSSNQLVTDEIDSRVWGSSLIDGSGTANYTARWTDADTLGTGILYDNGTYVGIGTNSPGAFLHIQETMTAGSLTEMLRLTIDSGGGSMSGGEGAAINFYTPITPGGNVLGARINSYKKTSVDDDEASDLIFWTHDGTSLNQAMVISYEGNLGIGTTDPDSRLSVSGGAVIGSSLTGATLADGEMAISGSLGIGTISPDGKLHIVDTNDGDTILLTLENRAGGVGSTDETAKIKFTLDSGGVVSVIAGAILAGKEGDYVDIADRDSFLAFQTVADGTAAEQMRIASNGYVGIGTTSPSEDLHLESVSDTAIRLVTTSSTADSLIQFYTSSGADFAIGVDGDDGDKFKIATGSSIASGEVLTIDGTNVGIGATSPGVRFEVSEDNSGSNGGRVFLRNPSEAVNSSSVLYFGTGSGAPASSNLMSAISGKITQADPSVLKGELQFHINTGDSITQAMTISDAGNVGIGTTSPGAKLEITGDILSKESGSNRNHITVQSDGNSAAYNDIFQSRYTTATSGINRWSHSFRKDNYFGEGTDGLVVFGEYYGAGSTFDHYIAPILLQADGDVILAGAGNATNGYVGIGTNDPSELLDVTGSSGSVEISSGGNQMDFTRNGWNYIQALGGSSAGLGLRANNASGEGLWIEYGGYVGIGTTNPTVALDVDGNGRFRSVGSGTYATPLNRASDGTLTTATSDIRLKTNLDPLENSLDNVLKMQAYTFNWKSEPGGPRDLGLMAQELEILYPELVFTNPADGYKGINYPLLSAVLVEAVKETNAKFDPLLEQIVKDANNNLNLDSINTQIIAKDFLNASAQGLSTKVINDPVNGVTDDDFTVSSANLNGALAIDSANGRLYFRYDDNWHYVNQTGGFQIPNYETAPTNQLNSKAKRSKKEALAYESSAYDDYLTEKLMPGDFLIPYVDEYLPDGAVHGLYARFSDVKGKMFKEEQAKLDSLVTLADSNLESITDLESAIDENFSLVGGRLEELEERLEDLEWQATNNEEAIEGLDARQGELEAKLMSLEDLLNGNTSENSSSSSGELEFLPQFISASDEGILTLGADTLIEGKLTVTAIETQTMASQQVTTEDMAAGSVKTDDISLSKTTSGVGTIGAGETEMEIETNKAGHNNYIYLSPVSSTFGKDLYLDDIKDGESFTVKISDPDEPLDEDITFNWLIILGQ